jgi:hypothetical protein
MTKELLAVGPRAHSIAPLELVGEVALLAERMDEEAHQAAAWPV